MKKCLLAIAMVTVLFMTGCNQKEKVKNTDIQQSPINQQVEEVKEEEKANVASLNYNLAFVSVLEDFYHNHTLLDGTQLVSLDSEEQETKDKFAFIDIDSDGREELIISYNSGPMSDIMDIIYDYDFNIDKVTEEARFNPSPVTTYYDSGIVYEKGLHNQGMEDPWPYTLYKYNTATDKYDSIDKDVEDLGEEINIPFQDLTLENIETLKK